MTVDVKSWVVGSAGASVTAEVKTGPADVTVTVDGAACIDDCHRTSHRPNRKSQSSGRSHHCNQHAHSDSDS